MKKLRWILAIAFLIAGVAGGLYFGGYDLLFKPIFTACVALDAGQITAAIIWTTIVNAFLSVIVMSVIIFVGFIGFAISMPKE